MKRKLTYNDYILYLKITQKSEYNPEIEDTIYPINNESRLNYYLTIESGFNEKEILNKAELIIAFKQPNTDFNIYLYSPQGKLINTVIVKKDNYEVNQDRTLMIDIVEAFKSIDLSNEFNNTLILYLKHNLSNNILFYNNSQHQLIYSPLTIFTEEVSGLNNIYTYDKIELVNAGTSYINLFNNNLIHVFPSLVNCNSVHPIEFNFIYNDQKTPHNSFMNNVFSANLGYKLNYLYKNYIDIILEDYTGYQTTYTLVNDSKEVNKISEELGFEIGDNDKIYFCYENKSCIKTPNIVTNQSTINLISKNKDNIILKMVSDNFFRIEEIKKKDNTRIQYFWLNDRLSEINYFDIAISDRLVFYYTDTDNCSNVIWKIKNPKRNTSIEIQYKYLGNDNQIEIKYLSQDSYTIKRMVLTFANEKLASIFDSSASRTLSYDSGYTGYNISKNGQKDYLCTYIKDGLKTKKVDYKNRYTYYYFNDIGLCKFMIDDRNRSMNYRHYADFYQKYLVKSSESFHHTPVFVEESNYEKINSDIENSKWIVQGLTNSTISTSPNGLFNEQCLKIDKVANETIILKQEISGIRRIIQSKFFGYLYSALDFDENEIEIKIEYKYNIGTNTQTITKFATLATNTGWKKFESEEFMYPYVSSNPSATIIIKLSGRARTILIDKLQVISADLTRRNNLIVNANLGTLDNWSFENINESVEKLVTAPSSDFYAYIIGEKAMYFKNNLAVDENGNLTIKKMYQQITLKGSHLNKFSFSVLGKGNASENQVFRAYVKFFYDDQKDNTFYFDFEKHFNYWQSINEFVTPEKDFNKIEVGVEIESSCEVYLNVFQLYYDACGAYYFYDKNQNISEYMTADSNSTKIVYGKADRIDKIFNSNGEALTYKYNEDDILRQIIDNKGNYVQFTYNSNNLITEKGFYNKDNIKLYCIKFEYDSSGNLIKSINEFNKETSYEYNFSNFQTSTTFSDGTKLERNCNSDETLNNIRFYYIPNNQQQYYSTFNTYDELKNINKMTTFKNLDYNFNKTINPNATKIEEILIENNLLEKLHYNSITSTINNELVTKKEGYNNTIYEFEYDDLDRMISVTVNGIKTYQYNYDEFDRIVEIKDLVKNKVEYFNYDLNNNLLQYCLDNRSTSYTYDNQQNPQTLTFKDNNSYHNYSYEYIYEHVDKNLDNFIYLLTDKLNDDVVYPNLETCKGMFGAELDYEDNVAIFETHSDLNNNYVIKTKNELIYKKDSINSKKTASNQANEKIKNWQKQFENTQSIFLLFKPVEINNTDIDSYYVASVTDQNYLEMGSLFINSSGSVYFKDHTTNSTCCRINNKLKFNQWNLIGFSIDYQNQKSEVTIYCNGFASSSSLLNHKFACDYFRINNAKQLTNIVDEDNDDSSYIFSLGFISFGNRVMQDDTCSRLYNELLKCIETQIESKESGVCYNYEKSGFDVVSFNSTFISQNKVKPTKIFEVPFEESKIKTSDFFKYDEQLKRFVYKARSYFNYKNLHYYQDVSYKIPEKGILTFMFKQETTNKSARGMVNIGTKYEFKCFYSNLNFFINESSVATKEIEFDKWYRLTIFYSSSYLKVYIDKELFYSGLNSYNFGQSEINFGNEFDGCFSMFAFSNYEETSSNLNSVINELENAFTPITYKKKYDEQNRLVEENIYTSNTTISKSYTYNINNLASIEDDTSLTSYSYNDSGSVSSINTLNKENNQQSTVSYQYDTFNRLIKTTNGQNVEEVTYDEDGNILTIVKTSNSQQVSSKTFTYNLNKLTAITDSVDSSSNISITYNGFYPSSINNTVLSWEGKRLKQYGDIASYEYNSLGIRTSKQVGNKRYNYFVDGDRVLAMDIYDGDLQYGFYLVFDYDESGKLISVSEPGYTFFYIRDGLGNIIKLVDEQGNDVVKYSYDSWGKVTINTISSLHPSARFNPFMYKGYIYDVETGLFWLSSRYYSPELCRFISPDSVDYLDPSSINGLNLYAYCNNDPINYADPSGHVAISIGLLLAIGGIVGAVIGAGASVAGQYLANGCSWENFSWGQLALDTVLGGVSGMLSMSPLGWGTMIAANAGIGFVGAVGGHLINGSDFSKLSTWVDIGLSTGLGALVGVVGGPGALNAGNLNVAKQTAGFIRAAGLYDDVLTKAVTGFYRTPGIASNALRLSGQNLVKQWNKMVASQAGKALTKALAYGGTALLIGTAGKGWLYDWYNDYF